MLNTLAIVIFTASTIVQLIYWVFIFSRLARFKVVIPERTDEDVEQEVSVIICAKNEAANLRKNLPRILNQNYHSFEVVVVNDHSTDESLDVLHSLSKDYPQLKIVNYTEEKEFIGKKPALAKGIQASKYEIVLLTDADCYPSSDKWIWEMQHAINDQIELGLAYAPYINKKILINFLIRFETVYTAIQYLSFALVGHPYMGVGRNLIYKKTLYKKVDGFKKHEHIASGDDDLLINEIAKKSNTKVILSPNTFMYSPAEKTWKDYYRQKSRHLSTGRHYKLKNQLFLGLLSASHFCHYIVGFFVICKISTIFAVLMYVVRIVAVNIVYGSTLRRLQDHSLLKWVPLLDFLYIFYYIIFAPILFIGNTIKWK